MSVNEYVQRPNLARFPFAFIVTYARSGSTLLQGILNSIPGYCVRGENYSALFYLFVAAQHIGEAHWRFGTRETDSRDSWFGADQFDPELFSRYLADAFLNGCLKPPARTRCIGFKEIRYLQSEIPDELFAAYLDFLQTVFPGAALIFNVRNVADAATSGWWQDRDPVLVQDQLNRAVDRFKKYASGRPSCFFFSYDSLISEAGYCKSLFDFLGERFDHQALERLLAQRHGYSIPRRKKDEDKAAATEERFGHGKSLGVEAALIANLRKSVEAKSAEIRDLRDMLQDRDEKLLDLRIRLNSIKESSSWRLTAPLRKLSLFTAGGGLKPSLRQQRSGKN